MTEYVPSGSGFIKAGLQDLLSSKPKEVMYYNYSARYV